MKIGVIQTGNVRGELSARYGEYPAMFETMMRPVLPEATFEVTALINGAPLPEPTACDAWMITGSRHGVYDEEPWIAPLEAFLRAARAAGRPIIGVCFGHQIMAQAFGGRAEKFSGGWRLGVHRFDFPLRPDWAGLDQPVALHSVHQDQVTAIPADATVWATSEGCVYAGLVYGDPAAPDAISVQPHPEMAPDFTRDLAAHLHEEGRVPAATGEAALAVLGRPVDNAAMARAFAGYLRRAAETRRAA
jgi:GMP synthase (glutamine-hydrolysing)